MKTALCVFVSLFIGFTYERAMSDLKQINLDILGDNEVTIEQPTHNIDGKVESTSYLTTTIRQLNSTSNDTSANPDAKQNHLKNETQKNGQNYSTSNDTNANVLQKDFKNDSLYENAKNNEKSINERSFVFIDTKYKVPFHYHNMMAKNFIKPLIDQDFISDAQPWFSPNLKNYTLSFSDSNNKEEPLRMYMSDANNAYIQLNKDKPVNNVIEDESRNLEQKVKAANELIDYQYRYVKNKDNLINARDPVQLVQESPEYSDLARIPGVHPEVHMIGNQYNKQIKTSDVIDNYQSYDNPRLMQKQNNDHRENIFNHTKHVSDFHESRRVNLFRKSDIPKMFFPNTFKTLDRNPDDDIYGGDISWEQEMPPDTIDSYKNFQGDDFVPNQHNLQTNNDWISNTRIDYQKNVKTDINLEKNNVSPKYVDENKGYARKTDGNINSAMEQEPQPPYSKISYNYMDKNSDEDQSDAPKTDGNINSVTGQSPQFRYSKINYINKNSDINNNDARKTDQNINSATGQAQFPYSKINYMDKNSDENKSNGRKTGGNINSATGQAPQFRYSKINNNYINKNSVESKDDARKTDKNENSAMGPPVHRFPYSKINYNYTNTDENNSDGRKTDGTINSAMQQAPQFRHSKINYNYIEENRDENNSDASNTDGTIQSVVQKAPEITYSKINYNYMDKNSDENKSDTRKTDGNVNSDKGQVPQFPYSKLSYIDKYSDDYKSNARKTDGCINSAIVGQVSKYPKSKIDYNHIVAKLKSGTSQKIYKNGQNINSNVYDEVKLSKLSTIEDEQINRRVNIIHGEVVPQKNSYFSNNKPYLSGSNDIVSGEKVKQYYLVNNNDLNSIKESNVPESFPQTVKSDYFKNKPLPYTTTNAPAITNSDRSNYQYVPTIDIQHPDSHNNYMTIKFHPKDKNSNIQISPTTVSENQPTNNNPESKPIKQVYNHPDSIQVYPKLNMIYHDNRDYAMSGKNKGPYPSNIIKQSLKRPDTSNNRIMSKITQPHLEGDEEPMKIDLNVNAFQELNKKTNEISKTNSEEPHFTSDNKEKSDEDRMMDTLVRRITNKSVVITSKPPKGCRYPDCLEKAFLTSDPNNPTCECEYALKQNPSKNSDYRDLEIPVPDKYVPAR